MSYKRKETIGSATLYLGNALEIMPTLEKVDLVVTDPPYKLTQGGGGGSLGGKLSSRNYDNRGEIIQCNVEWSDFMPLIYQSLKENAHAYVMSNNRHVQNLLNSAENAGFGYHNLLLWNKITATSNRWYMKNIEYIGFFYKGFAFQINDCGSKQLIKIPNVLNSPHPTEKPVELMEHYINNSSQKGKTVLDPFMGIGTSGVACVKSGRKFIGIEIDEKYFNIACQRIEDANKQGRLF